MRRSHDRANRRLRTAAAGLAIAVAAAAGWVQPAGASAVEPPAIPRAVYIVKPGIGFRVGVQGRAMGNFLLPVRCGGVSFIVRRIPIGPKGAFRFEGWSRGANRVSIQLSGRFADRTRAVGQVRATGRGCPGKAVRFVARLS